MDPEQEKGQSLYKMYQIINTESNRAMKSDVRACWGATLMMTRLQRYVWPDTVFTITLSRLESWKDTNNTIHTKTFAECNEMKITYLTSHKLLMLEKKCKSVT